MTCPKCKGIVRVIDIVHNTTENEEYRKRECLYCGYTFYTSEFEVEFNSVLESDWHKYYRKKEKES